MIRRSVVSCGVFLYATASNCGLHIVVINLSSLVYIFLYIFFNYDCNGFFFSINYLIIIFNLFVLRCMCFMLCKKPIGEY